MMKSPTSLIRFRNAVGVMLALSAVFAVVISAVTFTDDRALGQATDVTVSIVEAELTFAENDNTAEVSLQFDVPADGTAPTSGQAIALTMGAEGDTALANTDTVGNDYTGATSLGIDSLTEVTPVTETAAGEYTANIVITLTQDNVAEPVETFTVSIGTLAAGFVASASESTVTITITDAGDNDTATGDVTITIPDGDDDDTDPDLATGATVRQPLTADVSGIDDPDHDDLATTGQDEGATVGEDFPEGFTYSWQQDDGDDVAETLNKVVGTDKTYMPDDNDVGETLILVVTWSDKYGNGNATPQTLTTSTTSLGATTYDEARPYIIVGDLVADTADADADNRLAPDVELTADWSGIMFNDQNQLLKDDEVVMKNLAGAAPNMEAVDNGDVMLTWYRGDTPIICDADANTMIDEDEICTYGPISSLQANNPPTYALTADDIGMSVTLRATYENPVLIDDPDDAAAKVIKQDDQNNDVTETETFGTSKAVTDIVSPAGATGRPNISGTAQVGSSLMAEMGNIGDLDASNQSPTITNYQWVRVDDEGEKTVVSEGAEDSSYPLDPADVGHTIMVRVTVADGTRDTDMLYSLATTSITGSPGAISRIEPGIRGITVSGGDKVTLSVNIYGLQDAKDNGIGGTFTWDENGDEIDDESGRTLDYEASSSPGKYLITASLSGADCQPEVEADRGDACSAEFDVTVRRPSADGPEQDDPVNPPGTIPGILADSDGNQYEVFTPVEGGTFTGEGYSLTVDPGAVPNGEFLGIRMSDEGAASNVGMTHQRYTLGGNMYAISAVDSSQATISSYVLDDPAMACVPLPDALRSNISDLALVAINGDGSLTILAAQVRISSAGNMVCGALSNLPASVAVGSSGAPAAIPTPTPEPTAVPPPTGGTAPASSMVVLWSLLLGVAVFALGSVLVIARRREGARTR